MRSNLDTISSMINLNFAISLLFFWFNVLNPSPPSIQYSAEAHHDGDSLIMVDAGHNEEGFYLFYHDTERTKRLILFIHGYGAINPMIYGGWIKHLTQQGLIVVFPRYQLNLLSPSPKKFAACVSFGYKNAIEYLQEHSISYTDEDFYIVGHSYGGALAAFVGGNYQDLDLPKPSGLMICQPGTGPFSSFNLDDYSFIPEDVKVAVVVGDKDHTVGDVLAKKIYNTTVVKDKLWIRHFADTTERSLLSASHYEPYSPDLQFDNGERNYSAKRALLKGKIDDLDLHVYWSIFDHMRSRSSTLSNWLAPVITYNQKDSLSGFLKYSISP